MVDVSSERITIDPFKDITLLIGMKQSGKSYAIKNEFLPIYKRTLIYDYNSEYDFKTYGVIPLNDLRNINYYWRLGKTRLAYQPKKRTYEDLTKFCDLVLYNMRGLNVILEELSAFKLTQKKTIDSLQEIIDTGRHENKLIGLTVTSRRAKNIPIDIPYNADHILCFMVRRPQDIKELEEHMDTELFEELKNTPHKQDEHTHYFIYHNGKTGKTVLHKPL